MRYDPERHHRRSIRLQGYDYSQEGAYFVTVCVHNRECLLGEICDRTAILSEVGQAVERAWQDIAERFPSVVLDEYVLMPNHLHGILLFTDNNETAKQGATDDAETTGRVTLGRVLRAFKSLSAIQANRLLDRATQPFWQRNYYERIVRDAQEMEKIRAYVLNNPYQWETDTENPHANAIL